MPRERISKGSKSQISRLRQKLLSVRLERERVQLSQDMSARRQIVRERLDYDHPALLEARDQLARYAVEAEVARIHREITGYVRNGGEPPTAAQRESEDERRGWAMIEDILRGR